MANETKSTETAETAETGVFPRRAIPLYVKEGDAPHTQGRKLAALATSSEIAAYRVIESSEAGTAFDKRLDVPTALAELCDQAAAVQRGDLSQAEAMLINQATALQTLFASLAERGLASKHMDHFEGFLRLALRAQSQCRATLETLAAIKNPPVVYARQANVTTGPQQVNNGVAAPPREREIESKQTQLLRAEDGKRLDRRKKAETIPSNPSLEAVGAIYGT